MPKQQDSTHFWPLLLRVWFSIQLLVLTFDASFVLLRPHTFVDGVLGAFYPVFQQYAKIDTVYSDITNPFGWAMSTLVVLENVFLFYSFIIVYLGSDIKKNIKTTTQFMQKSDYLTLCGICAQFNKTLFYLITDAYGGFKHISHNTQFDMITMFIIPNGIWVVVPIIIIFKYYVPKIRNTIAALDKVKTE
jgi:hypothetical protein